MRLPRFFAASIVSCLLVAPPAHADDLEKDVAHDLAKDVAHDFTQSDYVTGLELVTSLEFLPGGKLVVTEKTGRVLVVLPDGEKVVAGELDVDAKTEKGLLTVIRHPKFAETHDLIFYYSARKNSDLDKHVVSLIRIGDDNRLDLASERVLVHGLRGPDDHEMGGGLAIDRSGRLLIGVGDTGCRAHKLPEPPYEPTNYFATCLTNGNGKILRIGLDGSIPPDNPLVHSAEATACGDACGDDPFSRPKAPPRRDIWVWGVRNPWRLWVDPRTGSVWTGDVGDIAREEIDVIPEGGGRHYGWPWREGGRGHTTAECRRVTPNRGDCAEPAYTCRHDDTPGDEDSGCKSINGGLIVDDCRWPSAYRGRYFFGDNANGRLWTLEPTQARDGVVPGSRRNFAQVNGFAVDFDTGPDGALYVAVMRIPPEESKVVRFAPRVLQACPSEGAGTLRRYDPAADHASRSKRRRSALAAVIALMFLAAVALLVTGSKKA
jgi:glucose/arabinose dehydrogenase